MPALTRAQSAPTATHIRGDLHVEMLGILATNAKATAVLGSGVAMLAIKIMRQSDCGS